MGGFYDYAFSKVDVKKIIDSYRIECEPRGSELWACCPFHSEAEPSFHISTDKKVYKCWGCGASGNIFSFVRNLDTVSTSKEVSYRDAVLKCCRICGIKVSAKDISDYEEELPDEQEITMVKAVDEDYQPPIFQETAIKKYYRRTHSYFINRGFKKSTLDYLEMGFMSGDTKDAMNNRCVFPIRTIDGELIGWTGRIVIQGVDPKWKHAPAKEFKKYYCLYNIDKAIGYIDKSGEVNVVESVANLARMIEADKYNTVATLGAGISKFQFDSLEKYANRIVFWYDWDHGGFEGLKLALSYADDWDNIFVAVTDYGVGDNGKPLDLGDVKISDVLSTRIITAYAFMAYMERRFVFDMADTFDKDTQIELPDGTKVICTNKLKKDSDIPQLLPDDVIFIKTVDELFGVRKISLYG